MVPGFALKSVGLNLPTDHMDITLHGNFISKVAGLFVPLFKDKIKFMVEDNLVQ